MSISDPKDWVADYGDYGKKDPRHALKDLVGKLGVKSAREKELALRLADLEDTMKKVVAAYGRSDQLIMSSGTFEAYKKAFGKP